MPSLVVLQQVLRELTARKDAFRIPEPELLMDDPEQVTAYYAAGREDGAMASVYLCNATLISEIILPGETVLDLGCGPANQLGLLARLNPDVHFLGVDLSESMLERAERHLQELGVNNVTLQKADITDLSVFPDASVDAVISTLALHHLPDESAFFRCLAEIDRVLKGDGGLYLADLGHLKTEAAIRGFAFQHAGREPALYVQDFHNSLRAAFELSTWRAGWQRHLARRARLYSTWLVPFMVVLRGPTRRSLPPKLANRLRSLCERLPAPYRQDHNDLVRMLRLGGLRVPRYY